MVIKVPRHEPEVVAAAARRHWNGDDEKVPTTSVRDLTVGGVHLSSRYDKASEYDLMALMASGLPEDLRAHVESIFCDSKATHAYTLEIKPSGIDVATLIANIIEATCLDQTDGHNGILLASGSEFIEIRDANWQSDNDCS